MSTIPDLLHRVSPILERETETELLPYGPEPWILRQCRETGLVYLENPPHYESFVDEYAWEITKAKEEKRRAAAEPLFHAFRSRFKRFRVALLNRNKISALTCEILTRSPERPLTIVEPGCGNAINLLRLMEQLPEEVQQRCQPFGIELSRKLAAESENNLFRYGGSCHHADAISGLQKFPAGSVDAIILSSFLEHEINPLPLLRSCRGCLHADGRIIVKVPNFDCFSRHVRGSLWCGFRWPDHVNYFTPKTLKLLVEAAGLRIVRMNWVDRHPASDNMYAVLGK